MFFSKNLKRFNLASSAGRLQPTTYPPATPERSDGGRGNLQPNRGFTIIELIVVVAIIGIVSGIIMASVSNSKAKGRDAKRIADISVIQLALENYYDRNSKYPDDLSVFSTDSSMPTKDPSGNDYLYKALNSDNTATCSTDCQSYHLGATLELYNGILDDDTVDADNAIGFVGADTVGCGGEVGKCYDIVPKF